MISCYAAHSQGDLFKEYSYKPEALGNREVLIDITHCGVCYSDIHLLDGTFPMPASFPFVGGHEIVGTIAEVGKNVHLFQKGQRVGVGWQCGACHECEYCHHGEENLCSEAQGTCLNHFGGYAKQIQVDSFFVLPIPDGMDSAAAAPLLCGGATVYGPLRNYGVNHSMRVGIIGIGGLGHLAIQFAAAMGCEVTAFSHSSGKEEEVKQLGAHHFVNIEDEGALAQWAESQDFILSTVPADLDWSNMIQLLKPKGKFCILGFPEKAIEIPAAALIAGQRSFCGSIISSPFVIHEMLEFANRHNISAMVKTFPMKDINKAIEAVRNKKVHYRAVLEN